MAPSGDGPDSYAQFYGSFLLGLCLEVPTTLGPPLESPRSTLGPDVGLSLANTLAPGSLPNIQPDTAPDRGIAPLDVGFNALDMPFELQWDVPQNDVAPSLDWLLNDNTAAGESALWGFGSGWAGGTGWNVDLTDFGA